MIIDATKIDYFSDLQPKLKKNSKKNNKKVDPVSSLDKINIKKNLMNGNL